jgi:methyltransferase (TIGR00027 family)
MSAPIIGNITETARWLAVYRSIESARPDALFKDPLAERFARLHAAAIAAKAPLHLRNGWPIVVRTKLIDDLVLACVAEGCDLVINLAAGLDTRPYRLTLPASLAWIEADLPDVIAEKERVLAGEQPVCRLVREQVDLGDALARATFLARSAAGDGRALVLTEGLLVYLGEDVVGALARELAALAPVRWWILDVASPAITAVIRNGMGQEIPALRFAPPNGVAFFDALGWRATDIHSLFREAMRLRRVPFFIPPVPLADPDPRRPGKASWSGVVRLQRT